MDSQRKNRVFWIMYGIAAIILLFYLLVFFDKNNKGGDIAEYYGMTETLINHQSLELEKTDISNLSADLSAGYYQDIQYYPTGTNGKRYPVHFVVFSLLLVPVRTLLRSLNMYELYVFTVVNWFLFTVGIATIIHLFYPTVSGRLLFIATVFFSPIAYFLIWPGADMYTTILLLAGVYCIFYNRYRLAILTSILASWQSQPLAVISLAFISLYLVRGIRIEKNQDGKKSIHMDLYTVGMVLISCVLLFVPTIYSFMAFGTLSPWSLFTGTMHEVHIHNVTIRKWFELFIDPNIGLFWYAPVFVIAGIIGMIQLIKKDKRNIIIVSSLLLLPVLFATNGNWHNGTAGFGPTRYALYLLPFCIYSVNQFLQNKHLRVRIIIPLIVTQLFVFSFNGFLHPHFFNTLSHSIYAETVLNTAPYLYNPSPEIFMERTMHKEYPFAETVVYKKDARCKKAFVTLTRAFIVERECGVIPTQYKKIFDPQNDDYVRVANYSRQVRTPEATLWPYSATCEAHQLDDTGFVCMRTRTDVLSYTGVVDASRFKKVDQYEGVWELVYGSPVVLTLPPGYYMQHYSLEGVYVNF